MHSLYGVAFKQKYKLSLSKSIDKKQNAQTFGDIFRKSNIGGL
jgi:hypothetical protein